MEDTRKQPLLVRIFLSAVVSILLIPFLADARLTLLVIETTEPMFDGARFGSVGQYERLRGFAIGELDPTDPLNAGIVNIDKAPQNASGNVEYKVDVEIVKPVNLAKGNGWLFYDVVNRGNKLALNFVNGVTNFLMDEGYTIVWSGWQGDVTPDGIRLTATLPIATNDGVTIVGQNRDEFIVSSGVDPFVGNLSYPADMAAPATLTVRENEQDLRQTLAGFTYLNDRQIEITRPGPPFDAGAIYEFIYMAKDPTVMGIGFAATRDVNAYLHYEMQDSIGNPNPLAPGGDVSIINQALAIGVSQSGRFLRDFIYQGFNMDEEGRQVFDGAVPIIAGSRKTFTNFEFAQPGRYSRQHEDHLFPGDQFPFTYATLTDPVTEVEDSILSRCWDTNSCPKIMHFDSETEIWQARGSLIVTDGDPDGPSDIVLPDNVRAYLMAGTQHGPAGTPSFGICQQLSNPLNYRPILRAVIVALKEWIANGTEPPASRYGSVAAGNLVPSDQGSTGFPDIPGVTYNGLLNGLTVNDHSVQPPAEGAAYGVLVSKVDADGNALAGVRHPLLEVPTATHTGWNLRAPEQAEDELCSLTGSYIPFAGASGDPRPSIEARYPNHGKYVSQVVKAAHLLVRERLLLQDDAQRIITDAAQGNIGGGGDDGGDGD